ncbi:hypothetical protein [Mesorhizobium sp.]|nr:hypothetical protein [Mesorhizobium sp.]
MVSYEGTGVAEELAHVLVQVTCDYRYSGRTSHPVKTSVASG